MAHLQEEHGLVRDVGKAVSDVVDALLEALELESDPVDLAHGPILVLLLEPQEVDDRVERVIRLVEVVAPALQLAGEVLGRRVIENDAPYGLSLIHI